MGRGKQGCRSSWRRIRNWSGSIFVNDIWRENGSIPNVEHDHDAPGDGPLLSTNESSSFGGRRDFGDVYRYLCRADTNTEAVDDTSNN